MNSQELQLVNYEQAKRLKELGFDWDTECFYLLNTKTCEPQLEWNFQGIALNNNCSKKSECSAPTVALALKWFRDEKEYGNGIFLGITHKWEYMYSVFIAIKSIKKSKYTEIFDTYESAESAILDELLNILEKEQCWV